MTFYTDIRDDVVVPLLANAEFGGTGAIRRVTVTGGGPSAGAGAETVTDYPCQLAAFPVAQRDIDGTHIKAGDWKVLVAPIDGVTPTTTDKLICSQGTLTIVDAGQFNPAGEVTHYAMIARK